MKYSFMSFSTPELSLAETLALAKRLDYDGIEPRLQGGHGHKIEFDTPAADRKAIKAQVEDSGIALCCLATSCQYSNPEKLAQMVEDTHRAIDLAGDVGAPRLRVFGGVIPEGVSREQALDQCVASLSGIAPHAAERGVTICVETHDSWCDPNNVAAIIRGVNHPNIAVNWDIMHPVRAGGSTMDAAFEALKPWIRHLHIHDGTLSEPLTLLPIGEGAIDHRRALELLQTLPYDGYISGEWIGWEPYEVHLPRELAAMKAYERELGR
ncbi:MAG: sugar phosphate isomerase/epimerase family protein [Armatimonadota bacterium]